MTRRATEDFLDAPNRFAGQELPRLALWDRSSESEKSHAKRLCRDWSPNCSSFIQKGNVDGGRLIHPSASEGYEGE
jgi:hypothetical protein